MVALRCTRKLLARLGSTAEAPALAATVIESSPGDTPRLGDWYANLMLVARRPLVLCVAERSLFAVILPLKEARTFVARWRSAVEARLLALGIPADLVAGELAAMAAVAIGPTSYAAGERAGERASATTGAREDGASAPARRVPAPGRRMLGVLNDMAWQCEAQGIRVNGRGEPDFAAMHEALDRLPCSPLRYASPAKVTRALFAAADEGEPPVAPATGPMPERRVGGDHVLRLVR